MRKAWTLSLLLASLWLPASASAQTGFFFDEFGAGARATAMGQAVTALANDYSAAYYNPAGLTQAKGVFSFTAGYLYGKPRLSARFPGNSSLDIHDQPSSRGLLIGLASDLELEKVTRTFPWFRRFAFGLASWVNLPEVNQYHAGPVALRPHFLRHDMRFQLLTLAVSMGIEVFPWLSVGGGIIPSFDSSSDQDAFVALNKLDDPVRGIRLSIHQTAKAFVVPVCGVLFKPPVQDLRDRLAIGVSFRGENSAHHGKGIIRQFIGEEDEGGAPLPGPIPYPDHYVIDLVSFAPMQVTAGVAVRPAAGLTLSYDMTWKDFSAYRTYLELSPEPPWKDTFTHRVGVEYAFRPGFTGGFTRHIRKICLRTGYYFEPTPVADFAPSAYPPNNNILDSDQDVFSAGASVTLADNRGGEHDLEIFFQYHGFHDHSRHAYIDRVYAFMNGLKETGYMRVELSGYVWAIGGTYTLRF